MKIDPLKIICVKCQTFFKPEDYENIQILRCDKCKAEIGIGVKY